MFGGYCVYCDEKVVALVCDDIVYLKPSSAADALAGQLEPGPPYPGAKDFWILDERFLTSEDELRRLVQETANALPLPKKRKKGPAKKA